MSGLCRMCRELKLLDAALEAAGREPAIKASGGWCAPADTIYSWNVGECHVIERRSYWYYLSGKGLTSAWRPVYAWRDWKINAEEAGTTAHGYISRQSWLPEIKAERGGIKFEETHE